MGIRIEQTVYETLPDGAYPAIVEDVTTEDGLYGPQLAWQFKVNVRHSKEVTLKGWCSAKFGPKTKLRAWTAAALGSPIEPGYVFDSEDVIGRPVQLTVIAHTKEDGSESNRVINLRTLKGQAALGNGTEETEDIPF